MPWNNTAIYRRQFPVAFPPDAVHGSPDRVTNAILEGRVAVLADNTPFALIIPVSFSMFMNTPRTTTTAGYMLPPFASWRYLAMAISLFLPEFYAVLISYNQGLIPSKLAIFIAATRKGSPFLP